MLGMYEISGISREGWIYIGHDEWDTYEIDSFGVLLHSVKDELGGNIVSLDSNDTRYIIDNDPMKLVFQWDGLFGITVVVSDRENEANAVEMLKRHCKKLNDLNS